MRIGACVFQDNKGAGDLIKLASGAATSVYVSNSSFVTNGQTVVDDTDPFCVYYPAQCSGAPAGGGIVIEEGGTPAVQVSECAFSANTGGAVRDYADGSR